MLEKNKRDELLRLAREGQGRNQIAKQLGVSPQTVSKHVGNAGIVFNRSAALEANHAWQTDAKIRRTKLGQELLGDLTVARERLSRTETARDFQLTAQAIDALTRAYVNLVKLEPAPNGFEESRNSLGGLFAIIRESVNDLPRMN